MEKKTTNNKNKDSKFDREQVKIGINKNIILMNTSKSRTFAC